MSPQQPLCVFCRVPLSMHESRTATHCSRPTCSWKYSQFPAQQKCGACGTPLAASAIAAGNCGKAECQRVVVLRHCQNAERQRREVEQRRADLVERVRTVAAAAMGIAEHERYPLVLLIGNEPRLIELSGERREALTEHLNAIVAASENPADQTPADSQPAEIRPELAAVLGQACGLCQGRCCGYGANAAYLQVGTIRRYRAAHPEKSASEVVEEYLSRLADVSVADSCIYHQSSGCGLSSVMRSDTCNRHFCQGLKEFRHSVGESSPVRGFFAIARNGVVESAAFVDECGVRRIQSVAPV
jgi:hypothetical protein